MTSTLIDIGEHDAVGQKGPGLNPSFILHSPEVLSTTDMSHAAEKIPMKSGTHLRCCERLLIPQEIRELCIQSFFVAHCNSLHMVMLLTTTVRSTV